MKTAASEKQQQSLEDLLKSVGLKLTELRIRKGYPGHLEFVADFDLPRVRYWRMEKGKGNLTLKSLHKVASIHGLSVAELFSLVHSDMKKQQNS